MEGFVSMLQLIWAPVVGLVVSLVYFRKSSMLPTKQRLMASAHGALLAFIYLLAFLAAAAGLSKPSLALPYSAMLAIPVFSTLFAMYRYKGDATLHLLQMPNAAAAAWIFLVGTMAVTGNWL
jgi:hypothetical protein